MAGGMAPAPMMTPTIPVAPAGSGGGYRPPPALVALVPVLARMRADGAPINILLQGPAGCGKSSAARWLAAALGVDPADRERYVEADASVMMEAGDWFGVTDLDAGTTSWRARPFAEVISRDGAVAFIDEANRCAPAVANPLLALMDHRGETHPPGAPEPIRRHPTAIVLAACNIGGQYTGTERMDAALRSRCTLTMEMTYLAPADEAGLLTDRHGISASLADTIVATAAALRAAATDNGSELPLPPEPASHRATLAVARMISAGATIAAACESVMALAYPDARIGPVSARGMARTIISRTVTTPAAPPAPAPTGPAVTVATVAP
jgi:nitric oxide reductase NorQ protein